MKRWTTEELIILEENYIISPIEDMLDMLPGRSKDAIQWKASQLGLLIRDGKQKKACRKIFCNITEDQFQYLQNIRNHSRVIREALDLYIKNKKD